MKNKLINALSFILSIVIVTGFIWLFVQHPLGLAFVCAALGIGVCVLAVHNIVKVMIMDIFPSLSPQNKK